MPGREDALPEAVRIPVTGQPDQLGNEQRGAGDHGNGPVTLRRVHEKNANRSRRRARGVLQWIGGSAYGAGP
ncbi:hypothetical protein GCM10009648_06040 [Tsukamurella spumae]